MRILFVNNQKKIRSRFIRYMEDIPYSDVAVQFNSGLILHSTSQGLQINTPDYYLSRGNEIAGVVDLGIDWATENRILKKLPQYENVGYTTLRPENRYVVLKLLNYPSANNPYKLYRLLQSNKYIKLAS